MKKYSLHELNFVLGLRSSLLETYYKRMEENVAREVWRDTPLSRAQFWGGFEDLLHWRCTIRGWNKIQQRESAYIYIYWRYKTLYSINNLNDISLLFDIHKQRRLIVVLEEWRNKTTSSRLLMKKRTLYHKNISVFLFYIYKFGLG